MRYFSVDADLLDMLCDSGCGTVQVDEIHEDDEVLENRLYYEVYQDYNAAHFCAEKISSPAKAMNTANSG